MDLGIEVMVKCTHPWVGKGPESVARFRREGQIAARITHQNVVRFYELGEERGCHFLVFEWVHPSSAQETVRRLGLTVREAVAIVLQAARGVGEAHNQGIVHCDLKPSNLLVTAEGRVKVNDWSLGRMVEDDGSCLPTAYMIGTPCYMSPERWKHMERVGPPCDVWALGATLYYLLAGRAAHEDERGVNRIGRKITTEELPDIRDRRTDVPGWVVKVLRKATQRDPAARHRDAGELAKALERAIQPPWGWHWRPWRWWRSPNPPQARGIT